MAKPLIYILPVRSNMYLSQIWLNGSFLSSFIIIWIFSTLLRQNQKVFPSSVNTRQWPTQVRISLGNVVLCSQTSLSFWGSSHVAFRNFWAGCTMPSTGNFLNLETRSIFASMYFIWDCDTGVLGCLSKRVVCFGVPGRKRFDVPWYMRLLTSTLRKMEGFCLFLPGDAGLILCTC